MALTDLLATELYTLARALRDPGVPLIVGGGYGLVLRRREADESTEPTLLPMPAARATEDLDVFLSAELIADAERVTALRDALAASGFEPVPGALYWQFAKDVSMEGRPRKLKVDLLAPPPTDPDLAAGVKVKARRVRPIAAVEIHARATPEAFTVAESPRPVTLGGPEGPVVVFLPNPYTYLVLKLHAYRDRREDAADDFGRRHATDLYRILAMTTREDLETAGVLAARFAEEAPVREARRIADEFFRGEISLGVLALREGLSAAGHDFLGRDVLLFTDVLAELLPPLDPPRKDEEATPRPML